MNASGVADVTRRRFLTLSLGAWAGMAGIVEAAAAEATAAQVRAGQARAAAATPAAATPAKMTAAQTALLCLLPLGGGLSEADLSAVARSLEAFYAVRVERMPNVALPKSAYYAPRARYRAEKLLDFLNQRRPHNALRIVGITSVDISTTKHPHADWGVMGLAELEGSACVLSMFRCRRSAASVELGRIRFAKTAVHEVGHTLGLDHCASFGCLMEDGAGTAKTTDRETDLCSRCREHLQARNLLSASTARPEWSVP